MLDRLLSFWLDTSYEDLSPELIEQAKRCMIDWVGVAVGGSRHPAISLLTQTVEELGGQKQAVILGTSFKTSVVQAALVNGTMSHVLDFDDTHLGALMHPSAPVIPALLAYGEWKGVCGKDLLLSFLLGFEMETRISMAMGESHYGAGWHSTATMGRLGAAAGVGKLAGLSRKEMAHALGLAGTQASGIRKVFGTMTKSFHPGKAAADGLLSVLLAQKGYTSSENILDGDKGLGAVLSSDFNPERGLAGLGETFTVWGISFKPFASCLYTHPTIDAAISLRDRHRIEPDTVKAIRCGISKFCMDAAAQKNPQTGLSAKFSVFYCAALALLKGRAGEDLFQDAQTQDPKILDLMKRVQVEEIPELKDSEARVTIQLTDGTMLSHHTRDALGSPKNPLSDRQLEDKAGGLLGSVFDTEHVRRILDRLWALDRVENLSQITSLLRKGNR